MVLARTAPVHAERLSPGYWRVTFDNAPINLYDPEVEASLAGIVDQLEADPDVKVVVFDSALPDFFMAHLDLRRIREFGDGMPTWFDIVRRLGQARFITVGSIRGRARGIGNEFLLASTCGSRAARTPSWASWRSARGSSPAAAACSA